MQTLFGVADSSSRPPPSMTGSDEMEARTKIHSPKTSNVTHRHRVEIVRIIETSTETKTVALDSLLYRAEQHVQGNRLSLFPQKKRLYRFLYSFPPPIEYKHFSIHILQNVMIYEYIGFR